MSGTTRLHHRSTPSSPERPDMAGSGDHTYIDPEAVRESGTTIGGLMSDMSPFQRVASTETQAGNFDAATWLEDQIHHRQASLLQHATHVKQICGEIKEGLHGVSDVLETTDGENAQGLDREVAHQINVVRYDSFHDGKTDQNSEPPPDESFTTND